MSTPELVKHTVAVGTPYIFTADNMKNMNEHCFVSTGGTLTIEWETTDGSYVTLSPASGFWTTPNTWQATTIPSFRLTATGADCVVSAHSTFSGAIR